MTVGLLSVTGSATIAPNISPSRITGIAPLAVFFDGTGTTTTLTAVPFHELDYAWDFGDSGAGNWAFGSTNSVLTPGGAMGGQTDYSGVAASAPTAIKAKNKAYGPISVHVFETAGTYTVTLTVSNGTITQTTTTTITVYATDDVSHGYTNVFVFANNSFIGAPAGTQVRTSDWNTVLSNIAPGVQCLLKRGDTFTCSSNAPAVTAAGPWDIASWGSGAQPIIVAQSTGTAMLTANSGTTDGRIRDLQFDGTGAANASIANFVLTSANATYSQFLFFNLTGTNLGSGFVWGGGPTPPTVSPDQIFIVNVSAQTLTNVNGAFLFGNGITRGGLLGCDFEDATISTGGYNSRWQTYSKIVTQHNYIARAASGKGCFNFHGPTYNKSTPSGLAVVSDNVMVTDTAQSNIMVCDPQFSPLNETIRDIIFERNFLVGSANSTQACIVEATNLTFRDNIYVNSRRTGNVGASLISTQSVNPVPVPTNLWLYNNTLYYPNISGGSASAAVVNNVIAAGVIVISNNLTFATSGGSGSHFIIGNGTATTTGSTNNSSDANIKVTPGFTNGSGAFILPSDFTPSGGSYAVSGGTSVPSLYDGARVAWSGAYDVGAIHH